MKKSAFLGVLLTVVSFFMFFAFASAQAETKEERNAQLHSEEVGRAKEAHEIFMGRRYPGEDADKPAWYREATKGKRQNNTCDTYSQYIYGRYLQELLMGEYMEKVSPDEISPNLDIHNLVVQIQTTGKNAAKMLLSALGQPQEEECGEGEGSFSLSDTFEVFDRLAGILLQQNLSPEDVGTSAQKMHEQLLKAARHKVQKWQDSNTDDSESEKAEIRNLMDTYNFSAEEMGLNNDQAALIATPDK